MKRVIPIIVLLTLAGCAAQMAPTSDSKRLAFSDDLKCRVLADVGRQLKADNYDASVVGEGGKIDCRAAFASAGLAMVAMDHRIRFNAPQFTDDDAAVVKVDFVCLRLCGHGEELSLKRRGDTWTIVARKTTWIS